MKTTSDVTTRSRFGRASHALAVAVMVTGWLPRGPRLHADTSASHTVTVRIAPISAVAVTGGDVTLTLSQASPSIGEATASDATTCDLHWMTNQPDQKITVASDLVSPRFGLKVEALNATGGRGTGEVTLSMTDQDFVVDVEPGKGRCDLSYTATTDDLAAGGSDVHSVIYTITDVR
jgi:hypothetical protein